MSCVSVPVEAAWKSRGQVYSSGADHGLVWVRNVVLGLGGGHWIRKPRWKPELQPAVQGKWQLVPGKGRDGSPRLYLPDRHSQR